MHDEHEDLRNAILQCFLEVKDTCYVPFLPDDWRKANPDSFNCSSFVQWLALRALGWSDEEKTKCDPPNVRALLEYPKVTEAELRVGDVLIYADVNDDTALHAMVYIDNDEVIGACEDGRGLIMRAAEYDQRWRLLFARRITLD